MELTRTEKVDGVVNDIYACFINKAYARIPVLAQTLAELCGESQPIEIRIETIRQNATNDLILKAYEQACHGDQDYERTLSAAAYVNIVSIDGISRPLGHFHSMTQDGWYTRTGKKLREICSNAAVPASL